MVASLAAENRHRMGRISHEDYALFRGLVEVVSRDEDAPTEPVVHSIFLDRLNVQHRRERRYKRLACYLLQQLFRSCAGLSALRNPQRVVGTLDWAGVGPVQVHVILVRIGDSDGRVEVVADAAENIRVAKAGFQDAFELVARHVDVSVEDDNR